MNSAHSTLILSRFKSSDSSLEVKPPQEIKSFREIIKTPGPIAYILGLKSNMEVQKRKKPTSSKDLSTKQSKSPDASHAGAKPRESSLIQDLNSIL